MPDLLRKQLADYDHEISNVDQQLKNLQLRRSQLVEAKSHLEKTLPPPEQPEVDPKKAPAGKVGDDKASPSNANGGAK